MKLWPYLDCLWVSPQSSIHVSSRPYCNGWSDTTNIHRETMNMRKTCRHLRSFLFCHHYMSEFSLLLFYWEEKKTITHFKWATHSVCWLLMAFIWILHEGENHWILNTTDTQWLHEHASWKDENSYITFVMAGGMRWTHDILYVGKIINNNLKRK